MTNSPSGNSVLAFNRSPDGTLAFAGSYATGGLGLAGLTGTNQGGLTLSQDGSWLFVVNAGSDTISVFQVIQYPSTALILADVVSSGGLTPVSVTASGAVVYVLDAGSATVPGNIAGFHLDNRGHLTPIPGSNQPLSGITSPAQISFNPRGTNLIVTEKSTNLIDGYAVNSFGVASGPVLNPSSGATPFGFAFSNQGYLVVSDASIGALSSYSVSLSGSVTVISGSVPDGQAAPCWVVVTSDGRLAFTANAHGDTISSYDISPSGGLSLAQGVAATTAATDIDMALSANSQFLYVYDAGANVIQAFSVHPDGTLSLIQTVSGITLAGGDGLATN